MLMPYARLALAAPLSREDVSTRTLTLPIMNIQLFYFDGCPSYEQALGNLNEAMCQQGLTDTVQMVCVTSAEDAHAKQFLGSPTIRIDATDLEASSGQERRFGLGCRVYREGQQTTGWPSVELIRKALEAAQG